MLLWLWGGSKLICLTFKPIKLCMICGKVNISWPLPITTCIFHKLMMWEGQKPHLSLTWQVCNHCFFLRKSSFSQTWYQTGFVLVSLSDKSTTVAVEAKAAVTTTSAATKATAGVAQSNNAHITHNTMSYHVSRYCIYPHTIDKLTYPTLFSAGSENILKGDEGLVIMMQY